MRINFRKKIDQVNINFMFLCFFCFVGKCVSNEKKSIKDYFARGVYRILSKGEALTFARAFKRISPGWGGELGSFIVF